MKVTPFRNEYALGNKQHAAAGEPGGRLDALLHALETHFIQHRARELFDGG